MIDHASRTSVVSQGEDQGKYCQMRFTMVLIVLLKVLLLEGIHPVAAENFRRDGYDVEEVKKSFPKDQLIEKLKDVYILGIR